MKKILGIFAAIMMLGLAGCASVPMASNDQDAAAKQFKPPADMASLYIYRNEVFGAAIPMTVSVNGKTLGQTAANTYFHLTVSPGKYTIQSLTENVSDLSIDASAGKNYFVWQEVKMGMWAARSHLQEVDETKGREAVKECKLITSAVSGADLAPAGGQGDANGALSQKLRELQKLRQDGLINEEDYEKKKQQLLNGM